MPDLIRGGNLSVNKIIEPREEFNFKKIEEWNNNLIKELYSFDDIPNYSLIMFFTPLYLKDTSQGTLIYEVKSTTRNLSLTQINREDARAIIKAYELFKNKDNNY
ncbi:hypothetical protein [Sphingobacterium cellulitidis]|uniref:Uncharacterized protein n=1 Tax=Sphingobacterium cellulitidis TaxID=1768011 RepID=A0A8H9G0F3_9SPHI|nr:hypothetical protein [Sphingobacterium soli]MBA8985964.1 hypothetical protein [Sphingobacterium soli]GGE28228.1 hypothetical protein GCM10011516_27370 [Sphingobacterium soli]